MLCDERGCSEATTALPKALCSCETPWNLLSLVEVPNLDVEVSLFGSIRILNFGLEPCLTKSPDSSQAVKLCGSRVSRAVEAGGGQPTVEGGRRV